jgi:hypothetical protein
VGKLIVVKKSRFGASSETTVQPERDSSENEVRYLRDDEHFITIHIYKP